MKAVKTSSVYEYWFFFKQFLLMIAKKKNPHAAMAAVCDSAFLGYISLFIFVGGHIWQWLASCHLLPVKPFYRTCFWGAAVYQTSFMSGAEELAWNFGRSVCNNEAMPGNAISSTCPRRAAIHVTNDVHQWVWIHVHESGETCVSLSWDGSVWTVCYPFRRMCVCACLWFGVCVVFGLGSLQALSAEVL